MSIKPVEKEKIFTHYRLGKGSRHIRTILAIDVIVKIVKWPDIGLKNTGYSAYHLILVQQALLTR